MEEVQEILKEADVKLFYHRIIRKQINDFADEMERQRKRAIEMGTPVPNLIRDVDDFIRLIMLDISLSEDMSASGGARLRDSEEKLEEQIADDEETRRLLKLLYERTAEQRKNKGKNVK
jgi:hypothetical protein